MTSEVLIPQTANDSGIVHSCDLIDENQNDLKEPQRNAVGSSDLSAQTGMTTFLKSFYDKKMLSPFQKEKLEFYFRFFDSKGNNFLEYDHLGEFIKKILNFTKWPLTSSAAQELEEVHETFYEVLKEKAGTHYEDKITLSEWLSLWEHIIPGCMGMHNCPVWLRLLPRSLFRIIDRNEDGIIDETELLNFYTDLVHLEPDEAKKTAKRGFEEMTDFGRYPLDLDGYEQIFANFLFGRTPYGPGRYIFGCFEHNYETTKFKLIQPAADDSSGNDNRQSSKRVTATRRPSATTS